jgi:hypothetical protein
MLLPAVRGSKNRTREPDTTTTGRAATRWDADEVLR